MKEENQKKGETPKGGKYMKIHSTQPGNIRIYLLVLATITTFTLSSCAKNPQPETITGFYFDTFITITLYEAVDASVKDGCLELCKKYENLLSATKENSDIYRINHAGGAPVEVSPETMELIKTSLSYAELTKGRCDLTIRPLSTLWDFHADEPAVPNPDEIEAALSHVDYRTVIIEGNIITLTDREAAIDLGFIAKGYIADKLKEYLLEHGVTSGVINLGGNILLIGGKPEARNTGGFYHIGIEKPFSEKREPIATLALKDLSVVTSGVYERYFYEDNRLYHHILDTATGYPVQNGLCSVTIIGPSSMDCDALSTAVFTLGPEDGIKLINETESYECILVTDDYELLYSNGAQSYIIQ